MSKTERVAIWPFATPMDRFGNMADDYQGIYSRGLCRAIAEGLLRAGLCEVAVCLPVVTTGQEVSWAVMGREWKLDEVITFQLPDGVNFVLWGTMVIAERVELHVVLASRSQRRLLVDQCFKYPRERIPICLSEIVAVLASAIVDRTLTNEENQRLQFWGTNNSEAYLSYLEAWSASVAFRFGISVPDPNALLECTLKVLRIDPIFAEGARIQEQFGYVKNGINEQLTSDLIGYSEFAYPIAVERAN